MFVVEGDIKPLRGEGEPFSYRSVSTKDDRGVYHRDGGRVGWLLRADGDVLRGSGMAAPRTVAHLIGLTADESKPFAGPLGEVTLPIGLSHPGAMPTTGSLTVIADKLDARTGDPLALVFVSLL